MAPLLEGVHVDRLLQPRIIGHDVGVGLDPHGGLALGLHGDVPDRQADQPLAHLLGELGPVDDGGLVGVMGLQQHLAEHRLVLLRADPERGRIAAPAGRGVGKGVGQGHGWSLVRRERGRQAAALRRSFRKSKNSTPSLRRRFIMSGLRTISLTIAPIFRGRK